MRIRFVVPLVAALLVVIAAGGGYAIASGTSSGAIHACANRETGVLRLARRCGRDERAVAWNKVGPPGRPGAAGPVGPSDAYAAQTNQTSPSGGPIDTALTLPPGDYSVTGQCQASILEFGSNPQAFGLAQMQLTIGPLPANTPGDNLGLVEASIPNEGASADSMGHPSQYGAMPLTDTALVSLPKGGTIYDTCENGIGGSPGGLGGSNVQDIDYTPPYVTAIRVGRLHETGSALFSPVTRAATSELSR